MFTPVSCRHITYIYIIIQYVRNEFTLIYNVWIGSLLQMAFWMHTSLAPNPCRKLTPCLQEFRYGSMGISVLAGGCLFDREKRGFTTRTRSGQATLCLESPADPSPAVENKSWLDSVGSPCVSWNSCRRMQHQFKVRIFLQGIDIGARVFKIGIIRAAFNHGYHVLSTLFLSKDWGSNNIKVKSALDCLF